MSFPPLGYLGQRVYAAMAPHWVEADPDHHYSMAWMVHAMTHRAESIIAMFRDRGDRPGWADAVDVDTAPEEFLDFLGSMVGVPAQEVPYTPLRLLATNLVENPSFEADIVDASPRWWVFRETEAGTQTFARVNRSWAAVDTQSFQWQGTTTVRGNGVSLRTGRLLVIEGEELFASFTLHGVSGTVSPVYIVRWYDDLDVEIESRVASDWASRASPFTDPVSLAFGPAPVGAAYAVVELSLVTQSTGRLDIAIDAVFIGVEDVPYFDGSFYLSQWDGLIGGSSSRLYYPDPSLVTASKRELIKNAPNLKRGTAADLQYTAQQRLTDTRKVLLTEWSGGSPWRVRVVTFANETPDPEGTRADLEARRPAGYIFEVETFYGQTYDQAKAQYGPTYQDIRDTFSTYEDLRTNVPV